ncbi:MAG: riboflavin biosynthesis protein RibF, partial [Pseudomonadota bacterium]
MTCGSRSAPRRASTARDGRESSAGVMIFEPHPRQLFRPDEEHFTLTPLPRKLERLEETGLDFAAVVAFNAALSKKSPEAFVQDLLVDWLQVSHAVIGYDFFFGYKRAGTPDTLKALGLQHGFGVDVIAPQAEAGEVFSSSAIRAKLASGDVKGAGHDLGAPWQVTGEVVGGAQKGGPMGFPTANVVMPRGTALGHGIFAVRVRHAGRTYDAAAYLGTRPTFDDGKPVLEVFLFDFSGDLYGQEITVVFVEHIRPDRKFDSAEDLIAQMEIDCGNARQILGEQGAG